MSTPVISVADIRKTFLDFFASKGHTVVASSPLVPGNDPTLMFTNSGMVQFKDVFLGEDKRSYVRAASVQACLRAGGKHNDLENVGYTARHHTFFEMLGNWSFGDYFKGEALEWSWELLTKVYGIDPAKLYVTVFEGDASENLPASSVALMHWKKWVTEDKIVYGNKKDNFWEMGDTGPCGPCTEIHVDLRDDADKKKIPGRDLVNNDHPQVIEIWNNVFMQFNRKADSSLENLPSTHVDTGMGLERLAMALQRKQSNYDTDLFQTLIQHMVKVSGIPYGKSEETDIALRVIADHVRTIAFSIADGQLPANNGAGYVIRRILRRAVRYGYQTLGLKESFLSDLSLVLCELMGDPYQELIAQKDIISKVIREEENSFFRTLELGIKRMELLMNECKAQNQQIIAGNAVFELYDTYGFPVDLTSLIARENGLSIDEQAFDHELQIQKDRSRAATAVETADWVQVNPDETTEFIGYDYTSAEVRIIKYRKVSQKQKDFFQLVLNQTPFYPEGGGQVGDKGILRNEASTISIFDTKKENNLIIHLTEKIPVELGGVFTAQIDVDKRNLSADNHSATHLLHHALRSVLGKHVEQKGSLVNPSNLRFDFSHFAKITDDELAAIEAMVTLAIHSNIPLEERRAVPIEEAKKLGAMALFGEKYGDSVRVIKFGDSVELCGGIHVPSTGKIGLFKITSEAAVAAGIRRIEAITGPRAQDYYKEKSATLDQLSALLKHPQNIQKTLLDLIEKNNELTKSLEQFQREKSKATKAVLSTKIRAEHGIQFLGEIVDLDSDSVKDILFQLKSEMDNFVGVIGNKDGAKCTLSLIISENLVKDKGWDASKLIRSAAQHIQGGGGGQNFFATAGGKLPSGLSLAISEIKLLLAQ